MGKFAVKVKQILAETVYVDDESITTQEEANRLVRQYDEEVGVDPQEIDDVVFENIEYPKSEDPYGLVISTADVEG